jgi:hypothetical protein
VSERAGGSATRRFTRAALTIAFVLTSFAAVALMAGRARAPREGVSASPTDDARAVAATPPVSSAEVNAVAPVTAPRAGWQPPVAAPSSARRDETATPGRTDTASIDTGDWRDSVAAALGRRAVANAPLDAGAVHTHLAPAEGTLLPQARAPSLPPDLTAASNAPEFPGFDGGDFWFGPDGLVRMREAQR